MSAQNKQSVCTQGLRVGGLWLLSLGVGLAIWAGPLSSLIFACGNQTGGC